MPDIQRYLDIPPADVIAEWQARKAVWHPFPGPQTEALNSQADTLLFGGAAGGGKTDMLLGIARQHHRAVIFRREFPSLRAIIERSKDMYGGIKRLNKAKDSYNETNHVWRLGDNQIHFGSVQYEDDKHNWQGQAYDLHGFDEITEFTRSQFEFIIGWNRPLDASKAKRCRVVCTCNPPMNAEGEWIIQYWAPWLDTNHPNPALPGELRWFTTVAGKDYEMDGPEPVQVEGEWLKPKSRTFIPAKIQDNPILVQAGYISTLQALPEPMRSKMLYGDFRAGREDDAWQVIPSEWVRLAQDRWKQTPKPKDTLPTACGVDVARGGKDKTCMYLRWGHWFDEGKAYPGTATPDGAGVAGLVLDYCKPPYKGMPYPDIYVDSIGVGSSVVDHLRHYPRLHVTAVNGAAGSDHTDKTGLMQFRNLRAENWWKLREALDPVTGDNLCLPPDNELKADLCAPKWKLTPGGIQIESKEELVKRLGRSPDKGDALVYCASTSGAIIRVSQSLLNRI